MTLYQIIVSLLLQSGRASVELPRGLWLIHYPADGDQPARLVAGRLLSRPSEQELVIVRNALLKVLDDVETRVAYDLVHWRETDKGDWHGFVTTYRTTAVTDAFSPDPDRADLIRHALERRAERIEERRKREQKKRKPRQRSAADSGPKLL